MGGALLRHVLLTLIPVAALLYTSKSEQPLYREINLDNPNIHIVPSQVEKYQYGDSHKDVSFCERVRIVGLSRTRLASYSNSFHVVLKASDEMPEKEHNKVEICFHRNASLGLCYCENEEWKNLQMGRWTTVMSPYENRYMDLKFDHQISGSLEVSLEQEFQHWRLLCLGIGYLMLLIAPRISSWAPFYYSSSMALGIFLVVLVILFQGMKLLPSGRKSFFYLTIYGSMLGAGSMLVHYSSIFIDALVANLGLDEGMYNAVAISLVLGTVITGAAFGYWIVRKLILSEDGSVDRSIAQFVKWALRGIAIFFIILSTLDPILALTAVVTLWRICSFSTSNWEKSTTQRKNSLSKQMRQRRADQATASHRNAEFLSRSDKNFFNRATYDSAYIPLAWHDSPTKVLSQPKQGSKIKQQEYFSTFHKIPVRKFTKKEWEEFTKQSTREALADWASSPEVSDWIADNAHRVELKPEESFDEREESMSDSSEETVVETEESISNSSEETASESGFSFFQWL